MKDKTDTIKRTWIERTKYGYSRSLHFTIHHISYQLLFCCSAEGFTVGSISKKNVGYQCITKRGHVYLEHAYVKYKMRILKLTEDNSTQRTGR